MFRELSILRRLILLKRLTASESEIHVVTGAVASFITKKAVKALSVIDNIEPIQASSGTPSPINTRLISGHTEVNTYVSPTTSSNDGTTYTCELGRTVYGGNLDVVSGVLTVDRVYVEYDGSSDEGWGYSNDRAIVALPNAPTGAYSRGFIANYLNPSVLTTSTPAPWDAIINKTGTLLVGTENIESLDDWNAYLSNNVLQLVYNLATPQTYILTPQEVTLLKGQNNLWNDCGSIEVTYKG